MASKTPTSFNLLFLALAGSVAILAGTMMAQSSNCSNVLVTMKPCLGYITGSDDSPSSSCCTKLGDVVKTQVQCLCLVVNGSATASLGKNFNPTRTLALPGTCKVSTPSASLCNVSTVVSPSGAPPASSGGPSSRGNLMRMTNSPLSSVLLFVVTIMFILTLGNK